MHKRYLVTGRRQYRWHEPGTVFEANLDPDAERRAIERGSIRVLEVVEPSLRSGSYRLPTNGAPVSTKYDPGRSPRSAIREAVDAEFVNESAASG